MKNALNHQVIKLTVASLLLSAATVAGLALGGLL